MSSIHYGIIALYISDFKTYVLNLLFPMIILKWEVVCPPLLQDRGVVHCLLSVFKIF